MAIEYLTVEHLSTKDLIRIFSKISIDPNVSWNGIPCWNYHSQSDEYGRISWHGKPEKAHRFFYAWLVASLPRGRELGELDHLCRNIHCVNPAHLELVSAKINVHRGTSPPARNAKKTHCVKGHLLPATINYRNERVCAVCGRERLNSFAQQNPTRYNEVRKAAGQRYNERHPERRKQIERNSNRKRAESGYFQKRSAAKKLQAQSLN